MITLGISTTCIAGPLTEIQDTAAAEAHMLMMADEYQMTATAYCIDGTTATGTHTRYGVVASKPEWFGRTVHIYHGDTFLGEYTIEDTGGHPIRSGKVIDIWLPTYDECMQFGEKSVTVYLMEENE